MARSSQQLSLPMPGRKGDRGKARGGDGGNKGNGRARPPRGRGDDGGGGGPLPPIVDASLAEEARRRYLNYALSVITSRALPDARDGLKPVQRRILYSMSQQRLGPDSRPRKSAAVVGEVLGKYHPHGDTAVYDAMVRLAQDWVMRAPLIEGQGNFGSVDGDAPAAMRYTEAKLRALAGELLNELGQRTVDWRPNYDGSLSEPVVLPARFPNLLVNGSQGIAVGMATSIPPHNLGEVIDACLAMIAAHDPKNTLSPKGPPRFDELTTFRLLTHIKGPDFPTGGELLATKKDLEAVYTAGHGSLKLRAEWTGVGEDKRGSSPVIIVTSIPYAVERGSIVEKIAEVIISRKLPSLVDVRDESTTDVRIVLELKKGTDPQLVMAYLFKNTPLSVSVQVNLTCLVPAAIAPVGGAPAAEAPAEGAMGATTPRRLGLGEMLAEFLRFRFETVTRRLSFELSELDRRIHILEGLEIVFDALDEIIKLIRKSEGRADAQKKLMSRFELSELQTDAILELRLYRLARLEILMVQKELADKRAEAKRLGGLLKSDAKRWDLLTNELTEIRKTYGDKAVGGARRTKIVGETSDPEFQAEDFIVEEDANVILSAQGWVKRLRAVKDLGQTRLREGDSVLAAAAGSTRSVVAFFSNLGACYVTRVHDVPPSTGYGDPVQKLFKLADGERMIAMFGFDPRVLDVPAATEGIEPEPPYAVAVTKRGLGFTFSLRPHREPSTRAGRKFARLNVGDEIVKVELALEGAWIMCAASDGHALAVDVDELPLLSGAGKGSMVIKVDKNAEVIGATLGFADRDVITVETDKGKSMGLTLQRIAGTRGGRGDVIVKRDRFVRIVTEPAVLPSLEEEG